VSAIPASMRAALLTGHGGPEVIEVRDDVVVPTAGPGEVLVSVSACGVNNTDINTRIGWYSPEVRSATDDRSTPVVEAGGWGGELGFPRIQGADICGRVVAVGPEVPESLIGARVLVDPWVLDADVPD
jgi:NADPH:quinone reductase-like Zn-dependent oxidoreductase